MKTNVGGIDRILRLLIGLGILVAGWYYHSWFGLIGLVPILTAIIRFCPAYLPLGLNSCKLPDKN